VAGNARRLLSLCAHFLEDRAMSQETTQEPVWKKGLVYTLPGADAVTVRQNLEFRAADGGALALDVYAPSDARLPAVRRPAAIIAAGYSDALSPKIFPCSFKEVQFVVSWARLMAVSGMVAVTYTNREPAADLPALIDHIRRNSASLGIDADRIGVFGASGNAPVALSAAMHEPRDFLKCVVLLYGYTMDLDGSTGVSEAAAQWKFANACEGRSIEDLPKHLPLFVARAGREQFPFLNDSIDRFVAKALLADLPVALVNHAGAPHAFDMFHDTDATRELMERILRFMQFHLGAASSDSTAPDVLAADALGR
jgi:dienelactone hydrolase